MNKRKVIIILLIVAISIPINITLSKYVSNFTKNYTLEAEQFYFNSDKLEEEAVEYNINNWSGVGTFDIQFSVDNYKNNSLISDSDITYNVQVECIGNISCAMNTATATESTVPYKHLNASGTLIRSDTSVSANTYTITATPLSAFADGESVTVNVSASSTYPYEKTIEASFVITVGKRGISYEIRDAANQPYFDLSITNAKEEYKVITAFGSHSVGEVLTIAQYEALTDAEKENCTSAEITISFNPNYVYADTTSSIINSATKGYTTITENINGTNTNVSYVSSISFTMGASSGMSIRFYKKNSSANYTWPLGTSTSIVTFNAS